MQVYREWNNNLPETALKFSPNWFLFKVSQTRFHISCFWLQSLTEEPAGTTTQTQTKTKVIVSKFPLHSDESVRWSLLHVTTACGRKFRFYWKSIQIWAEILHSINIVPVSGENVVSLATCTLRTHTAGNKYRCFVEGQQILTDTLLSRTCVTHSYFQQTLLLVSSWTTSVFVHCRHLLVVLCSQHKCCHIEDFSLIFLGPFAHQVG